MTTYTSLDSLVVALGGNPRLMAARACELARHPGYGHDDRCYAIANILRADISALAGHAPGESADALALQLEGREREYEGEGVAK